jgi:hypothetical protein
MPWLDARNERVSECSRILSMAFLVAIAVTEPGRN